MQEYDIIYVDPKYIPIGEATWAHPFLVASVDSAQGFLYLYVISTKIGTYYMPGRDVKFLKESEDFGTTGLTDDCFVNLTNNELRFEYNKYPFRKAGCLSGYMLEVVKKKLE